MGTVQFDLQRIVEHDGLGMAITGMAIVFSALLLISGFVAALPWMLERLSGFLPAGESHALPLPAAPAEEDEGEVLAALSFALHLEGRPPRGD